MIPTIQIVFAETIVSATLCCSIRVQDFLIWAFAGSQPSLMEEAAVNLGIDFLMEINSIFCMHNPCQIGISFKLNLLCLYQV